MKEIAQGLLIIRELDVNYGTSQAIFGVSLEVPASMIITILGSNGAGKSTILKTVAGLVSSSGGTIVFDGKEINSVKTEARVSSGISLVPEERALFPSLTVLENLMMGAFLRKDRRRLASDLANIYHYFPNLASLRSRKASSLSGGEAQMLAIGRALMARPRLLLLDEPSLGLSPLLIDTITEIIRSINEEKKTTILLVEQNVDVALSIASSGYILENGIVSFKGSAEELSENDMVRQLYLGSAGK